MVWSEKQPPKKLQRIEPGDYDQDGKDSMLMRAFKLMLKGWNDDEGMYLLMIAVSSLR